MPLRFKLMTALFVILLSMATDDGNRPFGGAFDVFAGLAVFLVLSLVSVFPNRARADRVEGVLDGANWADRIEFEAGKEQPRRSIRKA